MRKRRTFEDLEAIARSNPEIAEYLDGDVGVFATKVFKMRMSLGFTQTELANKAQVMQKTISRIEGGDVTVTDVTRRKVLRALKQGKKARDEQLATVH